MKFFAPLENEKDIKIIIPIMMNGKKIGIIDEHGKSHIYNY